MKRSFLIGLLLIILTNINAQENNSLGRISGKVIDSVNHSPLEYATITLVDANNNKTLNGTTTSSNGQFSLSDIPEGNYNVIIEFIGYRSFTLPSVAITKQSSIIDLHIIGLGKKTETMQAVVVTAQSKLIDNKIDKMVFNAEKDLTSQSGVATDVLKKVPQISVDVDGNVQLSGSSSIRFLINGKPSTAFGSNIADVLQSIPASQIKSIEVITNPGAKYDAEGLGGIINIILKESKVKGINGNISLTGGTRMDNGSFNLNARKGSIALNAFFSGHYRPYSTTINSSDRTTYDPLNNTTGKLYQNGSNRFTRNGYQTGFGIDWTIDKHNDLSGNMSYNHFGVEANGFSNRSQQVFDKTSGNNLSNAVSINNTSNSFHFHDIDASINYKKTFSKEDQELDISLHSSVGNSFGMNNNALYYLPQDQLYYGTKSNNPGTDKYSEAQIDYTQPFQNNIKLGLGGKLINRDISSSSNVVIFDSASQSYKYDANLSNNLTYNQKVYAVYAEVSFPVSNWFDAKIGGRYERTNINAYFSNAQHQASFPGYNTFVPSIFFSRKIGDDQTIKISYSKRINRPEYWDLNPYINTIDPQNINEGNPYLQPEIGNRYELGYNKDFGNKGSFMINLFYRTSNHDIQPYVVYYPSFKVGDTTFTNVNVSTAENIGLEKNMGVNLYGELHVNDKLNLRSNVFMFYRHTINALDPGYNSYSFNYRFNINASYQFSKTIAAEFFGNFNSARHEVQGTYPSFTSYSFAIRKQIWNKKGSIAFTTNNPFNEYINQATSIFGPNFTVNSLRKVPFRSFGINFTWKFGKLEFKKEKEEKENLVSPPSEG